MYVRTKTFANKDGSKRTYLQIVEGVREGGRVRQKVVANLGRLEDLEVGDLDRLIASLARFSKTRWVRSEAAKLLVTSAKEWGTDLIFRHLWEQLELHTSLERRLAHTAITAPLAEAVYAMVLNRISDPLSKRAVNEWVHEIYRPSFEKLELHHFYRALDFLVAHKEEIELDLFFRVRNLFNLALDLVFWDTTSTYFEGRGPAGLAAYGYSRDRRPDRVQILVGVLMTREGIPIGHKVFSGNTADIETFKAVIKEVRERFQLGRVIFVGDRGMVSPKLLDELDRENIHYIVGVRLRDMPAVAKVLKTGGRYHQVNEHLYIKEVWTEDADRYIVCYNPAEAERDRQAREELLKKLQEKLARGGKELIGHRSYRRYLDLAGSTVRLKQDVLEEEAQYDGKYVLRTNAGLDTAETVEAYHDLWRVERAFRELKSTLDLRPIYHWQDRRVRGHVMVCFLALVLESALQRRLKEMESPVEYTYLIRDLKQLRAVELTLDGQRYLCRTELPGQSYEAFKAVGLRPPSQVISLTND
ncbi:MAG: IS1634 family transposase [Firmicutes bacterium]|nr:IS1634 family transposase [Bacillota bacterium]